MLIIMILLILVAILLVIRIKQEYNTAKELKRINRDSEAIRKIRKELEEFINE